MKKAGIIGERTHGKTRKFIREYYREEDINIMQIKEFYDSINGNYAEAFGRLMKDERILKYLKKFVDSQDFALLTTSLEVENYEDAFRAAHNLKGVSLNLALTPLAEKSSALCEELRHGKPDKDISGMYAEVKESYEAVIAAISAL